jgi:hypothetical protein
LGANFIVTLIAHVLRMREVLDSQINELIKKFQIDMTRVFKFFLKNAIISPLSATYGLPC